MIKAIFYKEWIKTRIYAILSMSASICILGYSLLRINRVIKIKGVEHLWEILISRDVVFIEILQYIPLLMGTLMAAVQFIPEMQQKRLKLTLHLPFDGKKMILWMLFFGASITILIYALHLSVIWAYLHTVLAPEISAHILMTALPWYLCGVMAYFLCAWVVLEPTWRVRMLAILISVGLLRIYFLSSVPQAYNNFLLTLIPITLLITTLPLLSVQRFKNGCQD